MTDITAVYSTKDTRPIADQVDDLLRIKELRAYYPVSTGILRRNTRWVRAVDNVSLTIRRGETLGLVGESGCGKTTFARAILGLRQLNGGSVVFDGKTISDLGPSEMKAVRRHMQLIFQDPYASMDPRVKVGRAVRIALEIHGIGTNAERNDMVAEIFRCVGLDPSHAARYPHEFSGGQQQRIGIARALILRPKLVVCDEPVSALDVSIQSQILNLLRDLQGEFGLTYLFVSHNLAVVEYVADRVAVMYLGKIVELAPRETLFEDPRHPYTKMLVSSIPRPDPSHRRSHAPLMGEIPSATDMPVGCRFRNRCSSAIPVCDNFEPPMDDCGNGHRVACWLERKDERAGWKD